MSRSKLTPKKLAEQIEIHKKKIAYHRDALRSLISDAEEIVNDSDEALDALKGAVEVLSRNL